MQPVREAADDGGSGLSVTNDPTKSLAVNILRFKGHIPTAANAFEAIPTDATLLCCMQY